MAKAKINNAKLWRIVEVMVVQIRQGTRTSLGSSLPRRNPLVYVWRHQDGGERPVPSKMVGAKITLRYLGRPIVSRPDRDESGRVRNDWWRGCASCPCRKVQRVRARDELGYPEVFAVPPNSRSGRRNAVVVEAGILEAKTRANLTMSPPSRLKPQDPFSITKHTCTRARASGWKMKLQILVRATGRRLAGKERSGMQYSLLSAGWCTLPTLRLLADT